MYKMYIIVNILINKSAKLNNYNKNKNITLIKYINKNILLEKEQSSLIIIQSINNLILIIS